MNSKSFVSNLFWRFFERCGAQGVTFVVSIVLARLLDPEVYGTLALVTVFTAIMQVFVDSGLATALIQKKDADDLDFSSVFYLNILIGIILYVGMYIAAPWIAEFYEKPELTAVIRVLSLTLVISGIKNVQQAYVSRNMLFKRFFYATLGGTIGAAVIGICMAYRGYGVWALVAQHLFNLAVDTLILWITVRWRPRFMFSWSRLVSLFDYGWKILVSRLIDTGYIEIRTLLIGKLYSSDDLAFYNRGQQFPNLITNNVNDSIDSVLFPRLSQEQQSSENVKRLMQRAMKSSVYIMAPLMMGLAAVAPALVRMLLTEKWMDCVPFMRIFCISYMFYPVHTANLNAIKAIGRSNIFLKLEIIKKVIGIIVILISLQYGVVAVAYSMLISSFLNQIINSWPNARLLHYRYIEQIKDILPSIIMAILMYFCVIGIGGANLPDPVMLGLQVILGITVYLVCSIITKNESWLFFKKTVKDFLQR